MLAQTYNYASVKDFTWKYVNNEHKIKIKCDKYMC